MAVAQDDERFRALFDTHFRAVYAFALRRASTAEGAADVAAETFTVAWRRLEDIPDGEEARLWLYGVVRRVLSNAWRGERRRDLLVERLATVADERLAPVSGPAGESGPFDADGGDVAASDVRDALAALADGDREVLVLSAWEELTPAEIATVLDLPPATVRTRLHRARARLRERLIDGTAPDAVRPMAMEGER